MADHDGQLEQGLQKVALYGLGGKVTHAALQQSNGRWRSKLGPDEDIETTLSGLVGPLYGEVVAFLKKPNKGFGQSRSFAASLLHAARFIKSLLSSLFRIHPQ